MNKIETVKTRMKIVDDIIKPHLELKAKLKEELDMLEYNEFRNDAQVVIEKLQKELPHLGKFYFDDDYDLYDDETLYYIRYENEASRPDNIIISGIIDNLGMKYFRKYTILTMREDYEVVLNRLGLVIKDERL